ncbi:MAG: flavin reductase [Clostridiales bacterium]|nr:flavin reductase [Candidatus Coliplasma equi]
MSNFKEIKPEEIQGNNIQMIGDEWMLITASDGQNVNAMTASWGCTGVLWSQPVAICHVRPQRYTYQFTEKSDFLTLSFFDRKYRKELAYFGSHSGRDGDKFAATGLTPVTDGNYSYPAEADMVLCCRKLYADDIKPECFVSQEPLSHYEKNDFHRMYVCLIEKVLKK